MLKKTTAIALLALSWSIFNFLECTPASMMIPLTDDAAVPYRADVTAPQMVEGSLSVDPDEAVPGDMVTVSLKASDDMSGVNSVFIHYKTENGMSRSDFMTCDSDAAEYICKVYIDSNTQHGEWKVCAISVSDNNGNNKYYCTADFMAYESATAVYICRYCIDYSSKCEEWKISSIQISDNQRSHTPYEVTGCDLSSGSYEVLDTSSMSNRIDAEHVLADTTWPYKDREAERMWDLMRSSPSRMMSK